MAHWHRITIEKNTPTTTGRGEKKPVWATLYANVPATVNPLRGRQFYQAQQLNSEITVEISLRYLSDVDQDNRVLFNSQTFEIVAPPINVEYRNRDLVLMCKEVNG